MHLSLLLSYIDVKFGDEVSIENIEECSVGHHNCSISNPNFILITPNKHSVSHMEPNPCTYLCTPSWLLILWVI